MEATSQPGQGQAVYSLFYWRGRAYEGMPDGPQGRGGMMSEITELTLEGTPCQVCGGLMVGESK